MDVSTLKRTIFSKFLRRWKGTYLTSKSNNLETCGFSSSFVISVRILHTFTHSNYPQKCKHRQTTHNTRREREETVTILLFQSCKFQSDKIFNWPAILLRLVKSKKVPAGYAGRGSSRNSHENGIRTIIRRGEPPRFLRWISLCRAKLDPADQLPGSRETFSRVSSHSGIGMVLMAD